MNLCSVGFLSGFVVLAAVIFHLPRQLPRQLLLAAFNLAFLATWMPNAPSWVALAIILLSGYAAGVGTQSIKSECGRRWALGLYLTALVCAFVILKKYDFVRLILPASLLEHPIGIVGLSYMFFRQIHFVVDCAQGQIENPSLWTYLNYQTSLFTLLAGPIDRYQNFAEYWRTLDPVLPDRHEQLKAFTRVLLGLLQVALLGTLFEFFVTTYLSFPMRLYTGKGLFKFLVIFYGFPAYIYFNFSGYCDMAIGAAALVGMRVPENFNKPFFARNMIDYWARWHITLTAIVRDYVFTPTYKALVTRWPGASRQAAYFSFFLALFLAGLWHGSTSNFILYGLLHGLGVSSAKWWEEQIIRRRGRSGLREYLKNPRIRRVAVVCTIHFACFTLFFFRPGVRHTVDFLRDLAVGKTTQFFPTPQK